MKPPWIASALLFGIRGRGLPAQPGGNVVFDEMVMSSAVSQMTNRELTDIVAWLRKPR